MPRGRVTAGLVVFSNKHISHLLPWTAVGCDTGYGGRSRAAHRRRLLGPGFPLGRDPGPKSLRQALPASRAVVGRLHLAHLLGTCRSDCGIPLSIDNSQVGMTALKNESLITFLLDNPTGLRHSHLHQYQP